MTTAFPTLVFHHMTITTPTDGILTPRLSRRALRTEIKSTNEPEVGWEVTVRYKGLTYQSFYGAETCPKDGPDGDTVTEDWYENRSRFQRVRPTPNRWAALSCGVPGYDMTAGEYGSLVQSLATKGEFVQVEVLLNAARKAGSMDRIQAARTGVISLAACPNCGNTNAATIQSNELKPTDPDFTLLCTARVCPNERSWTHVAPTADEIDENGKVACGHQWEPNGG